MLNIMMLPYAGCRMRRISAAPLCCLMLMLCFATGLASSAHAAKAADDGVTVVTVKQGQNVRTLAKDYLKNADLWREILKANDLTSAADVRPGMSIRIPTGMVFEGEQALESSRKAITEATKAGARIFATREINHAIKLRDDALLNKQLGLWAEVISVARQAETEAKAAHRKAKESSVIAAEAVLNEKEGNVQSRRQADLVWNERGRFDVLIEKERVRTLSSSFADILMRDESRLRLSENSQALIQKMSMDLLERKQEASVSLIEGDLHVLLAGGKKSDFDLKMKDIDTKVDSSNFRVNRTGADTMFSNYDGELEVASAGGTVAIGRNKGSMVRGGAQPTKPRELLVSPSLSTPEAGLTFYENALTVTWKPVKDARTYLFELARDRQDFSDLVLTKKDIRATSFALKDLQNGVYYWRVAAVDELGFTGAMSRPGWFKVVVDRDAPFVVVLGPPDGTFVRQDTVRIHGEAEEGVTITHAGKQVAVAKDGAFALDAVLEPGMNVLNIEVRDRAQNLTKIPWRIFYIADKSVSVSPAKGVVSPAAGLVEVPDEHFTFHGQTSPHTVVVAQMEDISRRTVSDVSGAFSMELALDKDKTPVNFTLNSPSGVSASESINIVLDTEPPALRVTSSVPEVTAAETLRIEGTAGDAVSLMIGGRDIALVNGAFSYDAALKPGKNRILIEARDRVGNRSLIERTVLLDAAAPKLTAAEVSVKKATGGEVIRVEVRATDESAMRRWAPFALRAGTFEYTGELRSCESAATDAKTGCYEAVVNLPLWARGDVSLRSVSLSDYSGNEKTYTFK